MHTTKLVSFALASAVVVFAACDDARDGAFVPGDEEIAFRSCAPNCPTLNTPILDGLEFPNWKEATAGWGTWADNEAGRFRLDSATIAYFGVQQNVTELTVDPFGKLSVRFTHSGHNYMLLGAQVEGLTIAASYYPDGAAASFTTSLKILDVECWNLAKAPSVSSCRYLLGTSTVPTDLVSHPQLTPSAGGGTAYFAVCPVADEEFDELVEQTGVVFVDKLQLGLSGRPTLTTDSGGFIAACYASALGKAQWQQEVGLDWTSTWGRRTLSSAHAHAILNAIMAWVDVPSYDGPTTAVGKLYCLEDPAGGLLDDCDNEWGPDSYPEAGYGAGGAFCTNQGGPGDNGVHRAEPDANANTPGWTELDACGSAAEAAAVAGADAVEHYVLAWTQDVGP